MCEIGASGDDSLATLGSIDGQAILQIKKKSQNYGVFVDGGWGCVLPPGEKSDTIIGMLAGAYNDVIAFPLRSDDDIGN